MSRTFRRTKDLSRTIAADYMWHPNDIYYDPVVGWMHDNRAYGERPSYCYKARGFTPLSVANRHNFRYFSDCMPGFSAPRELRKMVNKAERLAVRNSIAVASKTDSWDEFVNPKYKLPYWD